MSLAENSASAASLDLTIFVIQPNRSECGPYLDPAKVTNLPEAFGPGSLHQVLRESSPSSPALVTVSTISQVTSVTSLVRTQITVSSAPPRSTGPSVQNCLLKPDRRPPHYDPGRPQSPRHALPAPERPNLIISP